MRYIKNIVLAVLFTSVLVGAAPSSEACSCMPPTVYTAYNNAKDVVVARVIIGFELSQYQWYVVRVHKTFKGCSESGQWMLVRTASSSAACGIKLTEGATYLLNGGSGTTTWGGTVMTVGICSYNKLVSQLTSTDRQWLMSRYNCCEKDCECVNGKSPVQCFVDPCDVVSCPDGTCTANYCGGCKAEYYSNNGQLMCGPCGEKDACPFGQACDADNGICMKTCNADKDCGEDAWCSPTKGGGDKVCRAYQLEGDYCGGFVPAYAQNKCKPGLQCKDVPPMLPDAPGTCLKPCVEAKGCAAKQYCSDDKFCRDYGSCNTYSHCNDAGNMYNKPKCKGYGMCESKQCKWYCGNASCVPLDGQSFGLCEAIVGYGVISGKCTGISGCSSNGFPLHKTMEECVKACNPK